VLRTAQKTLSESWRELKRLQASQEVTKELIQESKLAIQESYAALERIRECMRERKNSWRMRNVCTRWCR
jgi:hypothetical protein